MGIENDAIELAKKLGLVLEKRKSEIYGTAIWYKFGDKGTAWLYFEKNWTEARNKAKTMYKPRKKKKVTKRKN